MIVEVTALCVTGTLLAVLLKKAVPEMALVLVLAVSVGILVKLGQPLLELWNFFRELGTHTGLSEELLIPLYKTAGISLVVKIGGGLCRDAGESALASLLEWAGVICVLLLAVPLMRMVFEVLTEILQ